MVINKSVLGQLNRIEGWKCAMQNLHWDASNMSQHKLCDEINERLAEFEDRLAEVEQGVAMARIKRNTLEPIPYKVTRTEEVHRGHHVRHQGFL